MKRTLLSLIVAAAALPAAAQSNDFSTWSPLGDVSTTAGAALLTTAGADEAPVGAGALLWYELEGPLGVGFDSDTYEGSAIATSFSIAAGAQVSVNWALGTEAFDPAFADRAYVIVDGGLQPLATVAATAASGTFGITLTGSGPHTLAFALLDVGDATGVSTLTLSGLTVTAVPEPASVATMLAGLAMLARLRRARRAAP